MNTEILRMYEVHHNGANATHPMALRLTRLDCHANHSTLGRVQLPFLGCGVPFWPAIRELLPQPVPSA